MSVVQAISDLQIPFHHPDSFAFCKEVKDIIKPDIIVNIGDELDFYPLSQWPKDPDAMSFNEEFALARQELAKWFKEFPRTKVCVSNHTWRPYRLAKNASIPDVFMDKIEKILGAPPGWQWAQRWEIDGVTYEHGDHLSTNPQTAWSKRLRPTVMGHHHTKFAINHYRAGDTRGFIMNLGCLIDEKRYAFDYNKNEDAQLGIGVVEHGVPMLIPMHLDKHRRWTGHLTL